MATSRSEYVVKNVTVTIGMQIIRNVVSFLGRIIFIRVLGAEYLGINSLFTQILTVLSFTELGIGNAMVYSLYKPLAENDEEKIKSLMKLYASAYRVIGIVIAVIGIAVIPFLRWIVGEVDYVKENLTLLYILFLTNTVISYFFVYKKSLIIADQKNYIVSMYTELFHLFQIIVQSVVLLVTRSVIPYLVVMIGFTVLNNYVVARKADRMYPYLLDKKVEPLRKEEKQSIISNVKALVVYKVGGIFLDSTDSIFISILVNVLTVGLYSNYKMIIDIFRTVGSQVMNSMVASIGNLNTEKDTAKKERVFNDMLYISAWFYSFTAVGLGLFLTAVIRIFFGDEYVIHEAAVWAACIYYYVSNMHYPCYAFRTTAGLFIYGKYVPIICTMINIVLDIVMGIRFQLAGILFASVIARLLTFELIDPVLIYKRIFGRNVINYFAKYIGYILLAAICTGTSYLIIAYIPGKNFLSVVLKAGIMTVIYNSLFFGVTCRTKEFVDLKARLISMIRKKRGNTE